jgi:ferredoxin-thioredoxin reductase catalytic chain
MEAEKLYDILSKYAATKDLELNSDREYVIDIAEGLLTNHERFGYRSCPCRLATGLMDRDRDIICPCAYMPQDVKEYGSCYCGLYVSKEWNEGKVPHVKVPERRPEEKQH